MLKLLTSIGLSDLACVFSTLLMYLCTSSTKVVCGVWVPFFSENLEFLKEVQLLFLDLFF